MSQLVKKMEFRDPPYMHMIVDRDAQMSCYVRTKNDFESYLEKLSFAPTFHRIEFYGSAQEPFWIEWMDRLIPLLYRVHQLNFGATFPFTMAQTKKYVDVIVPRSETKHIYYWVGERAGDTDASHAAGHFFLTRLCRFPNLKSFSLSGRTYTQYADSVAMGFTGSTQKLNKLYIYFEEISDRVMRLLMQTIVTLHLQELHIHTNRPISFASWKMYEDTIVSNPHIQTLYGPYLLSTEEDVEVLARMFRARTLRTFNGLVATSVYESFGRALRHSMLECCVLYYGVNVVSPRDDEIRALIRGIRYFDGSQPVINVHTTNLTPPMLKLWKSLGYFHTSPTILLFVILASVRAIPRIGVRSPVKLLPVDILFRLRTFLFKPL